MVDKVVKLLLLLSVICYGTNINLDKFDMRFFQVGVIALFVASLFDVPKRKLGDINLVVASLLGLGILNSFWHTFQPLDIRAIEDLFFAVIGLVIIVIYLGNPRKCYKYIYWAVLVNLIVMVFQKVGYSPTLSFPHYGSFIGCEGGLLSNSSRLAMYIVIILPFIWVLSPWLFVGLVIGMVLCEEYAVLIPAGIMLLAKNRILGIASGVIGVGVLHKQFWTSILFRWNNVWKRTIDAILDRPLLGYGLGGYRMWTAKESFNSYLAFIFGVGLLGVVWLGYMVKWYIRKFDDSPESLAVLGLLLLCLVEYPLEVPRLWFTIIAVIGFFVIRTQGGEHESSLSRA